MGHRQSEETQRITRHCFHDLDWRVRYQPPAARPFATAVMLGSAGNCASLLVLGLPRGVKNRSADVLLPSTGACAYVYFLCNSVAIATVVALSTW
jgi:hypothetical protein